MLSYLIKLMNALFVSKKSDTCVKESVNTPVFIGTYGQVKHIVKLHECNNWINNHYIINLDCEIPFEKEQDIVDMDDTEHNPEWKSLTDQQKKAYLDNELDLYMDRN